MIPGHPPNTTPDPDRETVVRVLEEQLQIALCEERLGGPYFTASSAPTDDEWFGSEPSRIATAIGCVKHGGRYVVHPLYGRAIGEIIVEGASSSICIRVVVRYGGS